MGTRPSRMLCLAAMFLFATLGHTQQVSPKPLITQAVDESQVTTLKGNTHPLAQAQFEIGAAPPDLPMNRMLLVLKRSPEQEHALHTLVDNQQDKASAHYHKWLKPAELGKQFGPSDQDLQVVTGWLHSHGFEVNRVSNGRTVIEFSGSEAQVEEALHTSIHKYSLNGEEHWANASDPQIPTALAPAVAGVWSLHDFRKKPNIRIQPEKLVTKYTPGKRPDTTLTGLGGTIHALSPADFATIYNLNPLYANGTLGTRTIAVVARSNLFNSGEDILNFSNVFGVQSISPQIINDGPDPGDLGGGEEAEATLDATWSGAIAPQATVDFVVSASTNTTDGVDLSELYIIDNNLASVMTESFGSCDTLANSSEAAGASTLAEQGAAQGITYMVSAGDSGAAGCDDPNTAPAIGGLAVNVLGTSFNVVVGGTQLNENGDDSKYWSSQNNQQNLGSALSYIPEDVWNESCFSCQFPNLFSSGGGASFYFKPKPTWQSGVNGIPSDGTRDQPDVSLTAALHDPYLLCLEGSCVPDSNGFISVFLIGGTSASSPSFAGIMNLVNQMYGPQGQANYVLYSLAKNENSSFSQCNASNATTPPASTCVFNDVTVGNNSVPGQTGFSAAAGYDLATGLGSVNVNNLVTNWGNARVNVTATTLTPGSISGITHGSPVTLTVSVAGNRSSPTEGDVGLVSTNSLGEVQSIYPGISLNGSSSQTATFNNLPGGTYALNAQYGGDSTFLPSPPSAPVTVTITPENSTTTVEAIDQNRNPFSSGPYGTFVYVRADVQSATGPGPTYGFPTGTVSFADPAQSISPGPYTLNGEGNTALLNLATFFAVGSHSIRGAYSGDASFFPSNNNSSPVNFTVTQANSAAGVTSAGAPQGATLTATVTTNSAGSPPSGMVTFSVNGTSAGTFGVNGVPSGFDPQTGAFVGAQATVTFTDSQLANGQSTVTASYSGDTNYVASTSSATTINIQPDFSVQPSANAIGIQSPGGSGSMTITLTDLDGFMGSVSFSCSGLPTGAKCNFSPSSLAATGSTTLSITTTGGSAMLAPAVRTRKWNLAFAMFGLTFGGIFVLRVPRGRRRRNFLLMIVLGAICVGCGGGGSTPPPPPPPAPSTPTGSYMVTINATSGATSHSVQFNLGVF